MAATAQSVIAVIGIDIGKNSFHVVGLDGRGAIVLRQKWSRGQVEARFANMPPCLIGSKTVAILRRGGLTSRGHRPTTDFGPKADVSSLRPSSIRA